MSFTQSSAQAPPFLGYVYPNPRAFSATPRSASTPFPAAGGILNLLSKAGLGSWPSCSPLDSVPSQQPASGRERGSCPCQRERSPAPSTSQAPWVLCSASPQASTWVRDSVSPTTWGESRASGGLHAAASSPGDGGSTNRPKGNPAHSLQGGFVQPPAEQPGSGLPPQSCCVPFIFPCSSTLPQNCTALGKPDQEPRGWRGRCCSWGVQAGYQHGVEVHSWGSGALLTSTLGMEPGRRRGWAAQSSQVRAVGSARLCLPNLRAQLAARQLKQGEGGYKRAKKSPLAHISMRMGCIFPQNGFLVVEKRRPPWLHPYFV